MSPKANFWMRFVNLVSLEWFMSPRLPNGGAAVLARSIGVSIELLALTLVLRNWIDPDRTGCFSWNDFRMQLIDVKREVIVSHIESNYATEF